MEKLLKKIQDLISNSFEGAATELEVVRPDKKISGILIWPGFHGSDHLDRQRLFRRMVREKLTLAEQRHVSFVATLTPEEIAVLREDKSAA